MKSYTYSEARGNFATVLEEAERDGAVEIRRAAATLIFPNPASARVQGLAAGCEWRQDKDVNQ